jgi:alpha-tubulin suppressor-like RCC1 family protein
VVRTARNTNIRVGISGVTARGPDPQPFRGGMVRGFPASPPRFAGLLQLCCALLFTQSLQALSCGDSHALALHVDGTVLSWGAGAFGRLGHGSGPSGKEMGRGDRSVPTIVEKLLGHAAIHVSAGHSHSAAVLRDGRLFVWGSAVCGKLGMGSITEDFECFAPVPVQLRFPASVPVRAVR